MTKYKNSNIDWIGKIPANWNISKFKYVSKLYVGNSIADDDKWLYRDETNSHPYISSKDISKSLSEINYNNGLYIKNDNLLFRIAYPGDTLMCIEGGSAGIKKAFLTEKVSFVNKLCCFHATDVDEKFLYYFLQSPNFEDYFQQQINGLIGGVSVSDLSNFPFVVPPRNVQTNIVKRLDDLCTEIKRIISDIHEEINLLENYRNSVVLESVTKGIDKNTEMKNTGNMFIGQIPKHWDVFRVKHIATKLFKGSGITKEQVFDNGDIYCVRYGEIYTRYNNSFNEPQSKTILNEIDSPKDIYYGDILFAGTGELIEEIGKNIVYLGKYSCLAGGDIIVLRHKQSERFLNYALNSAYAQAQKSCGKQKLKVIHISPEEIGNIKIAIPPIDEQEKISDYLDKICNKVNQKINVRRKQLDLLTKYRKSLIYEYITGKKDVCINE